ncbi:tetratricopeptide repeat protein [Jiella sp. M17.18]|uniref:tetratricopeptide repeat protein n=1 Tax=Jiella sp. M17.18 TaxID=3234247 RepID=UPI0034DEF588
MSDDTFFREVSEELRQDRVRSLWTRFGIYVLAAAVLVILITAGVIGWEHYRAEQANAAGDRYLAALDLAQNGKKDAAIAALQKISADNTGPYPDLARMSIGSVLSDEGKKAEAVAAFDKVAKDPNAPQALRDMADIRAAYILVDTGSLADVRSRVERLTGDSDPLRFPAREALALAAWKAGDIDTAKPLFEQLADDTGTPHGMATRARLMLDLISGAKPAAAAGAQPKAPAKGAATAPAAGASSAPAQVAPTTKAAGTAGTPASTVPAAPAAADQTAPTTPTMELGQTGGSVPGTAAPQAETAPAAASQQTAPASGAADAAAKPQPAVAPQSSSPAPAATAGSSDGTADKPAAPVNPAPAPASNNGGAAARSTTSGAATTPAAPGQTAPPQAAGASPAPAAQ